MRSILSNSRLVKPGDTFGSRIVIGAPFRKGDRSRSFVVVECVCGLVAISNVDNLVSGKGALCKRCAHMKHGLVDHPLNSIWHGMKQRCLNHNLPRFSDYGGRGISVCDEWKNEFRPFYNWAMSNGWKPGLQLDRINNDGNYEPGNCRFVTPKANSLNRRPRKRKHGLHAPVLSGVHS